MSDREEFELVCEKLGVRNLNISYKFEKDRLIYLCFTNIGLTKLPKGIFDKFKSLRYLYLFENKITELPQGFFDMLTSLEYIFLYDNRILELPPGIFDKLTSLVELRLGYNKLTNLPQGIFEKLSSLKRIGLSGNQLTELPREIFDPLTSLTSLSLSENQLKEIPKGIFDQLTSLTTIDLDNNWISKIPANIFDKLTSLRLLSLHDNVFTELPPKIFEKLKSLETLGIDGNKLRMLLHNLFDQLSSLTNLNLSRNGLRILEKEFFVKLSSLVFLDLQNNCIKKLPRRIFDKMTLLKNLDLSSNQLTELPQEIFEKLTSLKVLKLNNNMLTELPQGIFKLVEGDYITLEKLDLYNNPLKETPDLHPNVNYEPIKVEPITYSKILLNIEQNNDIIPPDQGMKFDCGHNIGFGLQHILDKTPNIFEKHPYQDYWRTFRKLWKGWYRDEGFVKGLKVGLGADNIPNLVDNLIEWFALLLDHLKSSPVQGTDKEIQYLSGLEIGKDISLYIEGRKIGSTIPIDEGKRKFKNRLETSFSKTWNIYFNQESFVRGLSEGIRIEKSDLPELKDDVIQFFDNLIPN